MLHIIFKCKYWFYNPRHLFGVWGGLLTLYHLQSLTPHPRFFPQKQMSHGFLKGFNSFLRSTKPQKLTTKLFRILQVFSIPQQIQTTFPPKKKQNIPKPSSPRSPPAAPPGFARFAPDIGVVVVPREDEDAEPERPPEVWVAEAAPGDVCSFSSTKIRSSECLGWGLFGLAL